MHTCTNRGGGQKPCTDPSVWAPAAETAVTHLQVSDQNCHTAPPPAPVWQQGEETQANLPCLCENFHFQNTQLNRQNNQESCA